MEMENGMSRFNKLINLIFLLWGIPLLLIANLYGEYVRYYLYLSILIALPIAIWNLLQKRKNDKINDTKEFRHAIYRMLIMAVIMIIIFFVTKQNHI